MVMNVRQENQQSMMKQKLNMIRTVERHLYCRSEHKAICNCRLKKENKQSIKLI
jgi:hypothetical protein